MLSSCTERQATTTTIIRIYSLPFDKDNNYKAPLCALCRFIIIILSIQERLIFTPGHTDIERNKCRKRKKKEKLITGGCNCSNGCSFFVCTQAGSYG